VLSTKHSGPSAAVYVVQTHLVAAESLSSLTTDQIVQHGWRSTACPTVSQQISCSSMKNTFHTRGKVLHLKAHSWVSGVDGCMYLHSLDTVEKHNARTCCG